MTTDHTAALLRLVDNLNAAILPAERREAAVAYTRHLDLMVAADDASRRAREDEAEAERLSTSACDLRDHLGATTAQGGEVNGSGLALTAASLLRDIVKHRGLAQGGEQSPNAEECVDMYRQLEAFGRTIDSETAERLRAEMAAIEVARETESQKVTIANLRTDLAKMTGYRDSYAERLASLTVELHKRERTIAELRDALTEAQGMAGQQLAAVCDPRTNLDSIATALGVDTAPAADAVARGCVERVAKLTAIKAAAPKPDAVDWSIWSIAEHIHDMLRDDYDASSRWHGTLPIHRENMAAAIATVISPLLAERYARIAELTARADRAEEGLAAQLAASSDLRRMLGGDRETTWAAAQRVIRERDEAIARAEQAARAGAKG